MRGDGSTRLTWWSSVSVVLALPVWWFVAVNGVMSRDIDGGIFLSVVGGLQDGLVLYTGVWDNKDPLFFGAMLAAATVSDIGPFVMDWLWVPVSALGAWLIARPVMSGDRALFVGLVAAPFIVTGTFYVPGWTNTPGTAVALLALGLLAASRGVAAGVALGLLAFTKLVVWPVGILALLVLLLIPERRRVALRGLTALAATMAGALVILVALGWLGGYIDALWRNRAYSGDVMTYFGFEDSVFGHLRKLVGEWDARFWLSVGVIVVVALAMTAVLVRRPEWRSPDRSALTMWLWIALIGAVAQFALTYVWPHHVQALYLSAVLAVVALLSLIPDGWPYPVVLAVSVIGIWMAAAAGSPSAVFDRYAAAREEFSARWAEIDDTPTDARLLAAVPLRDYTYARLGTNDDRGYLLSARPDAALACPQFHLYDFSPPEDFARMLECVQDVDVVLVTDNFVSLGNGGRAASVQPILQYVDWAFDCLRVDDRQVCTRRSDA